MPDEQTPSGVAATVLTLPVPQARPGAPDRTPSGRTRRHYREREACGTYVRLLTQARLYQLRVWCPLPASVDPRRGIPTHCGLFPTADAARHALRELSRRVPDPYTPLDVWRAVSALQSSGVIPVGRQGPILPLWVRRHGDAFVASCVRRGTTTATAPFDTPEGAHAHLWSLILAAGTAPDGSRPPFAAQEVGA